jgi:hypothetical protein
MNGPTSKTHSESQMSDTIEAVSAEFIRLEQYLSTQPDGPTLKDSPVVLKAALAAVTLAAADRPVNRVTIAEAAGFSRGTAYRHSKDAINAIIAVAPRIAAELLDLPSKGLTAADYSNAVQNRDQTIATLRNQLAEAIRERDVVLAYARDLHQQLAPEYHKIKSEKAEKVRHLRPVDQFGSNPGDTLGSTDEPAR